MIGYRFNATGVFGYTYYTAGNRVCSVSSIVDPSAPVMIHGNGVAWTSNFDFFRTIFPGTTRNINDESTGTPLFRIVFGNTGQYKINDSITVYCDEEKYTFYCDDKVIAKILRFNGESGDLQKPSDTDYNYEPYFEVTVYNGIETELLMLILAFPMLKFGL